MTAGSTDRFSSLLSPLTVRLVSAASNLWPLTGVALGLAMAVLLIAFDIAPLERDYLDQLMKWRPVRVLDGPEAPVTIVAYDDQDAQAFGKDVNRATLNDVVKRILAAGPSAVVLDIQFAEEDKGATSVAKALDDLKSLVPRTPPEAIGEIKKKYDATAELLETLKTGPVVGAFFSQGQNRDGGPAFDQARLPPTNDVMNAADCERFYAPAEDVTLDRPEFLAAIPYYANVRLELDSDGPVRRYNLFTRIDSRVPPEPPATKSEIVPVIYPSMGLLAAALREETQTISVDCWPNYSKVESFSFGTASTDRFDLANSRDAGFLVDFGGTFAQSFPHYLTFRDVLAKEMPERFAGKVVFLGLKNPYQDKYPTIYDPTFPGVAVHATVAHDLITGHQLRRNDQLHDDLLEPLACVLVGLFVTLAFFFVERWWILGFSPAFLIGGHLATAKALEAGYLVNMLAAGVVGCVGVLLCGAMRTVIDQRIAARERLRAEQQSLRAEQEMIRAESQKLRAERLGAFLSPEVAKIAGENPDLLKPQRQEISILFSDIRSFTTVAEGMPPETLAEMLSEYLTWMTEIVLSNHGTLDKYIGDAVMAIFGAPLPQKAHAKWACTTALEMIDALDGLNERWREQGRTTLQFGIGINTGSVVVGTMGSKNKPEYTCIGDDVNFASRAEGLTKAYGATIVVGESTKVQAGDDFLFRDLGPVKVKGKTRGVKIFELLGTRSQITDTAWIDVFHQGLHAFLLRDWAKAEELFERVKTMRGGYDGPSKAFLAWTASFKAHPPDDAWDGTLDRAEK